MVVYNKNELRTSRSFRHAFIFHEHRSEPQWRRDEVVGRAWLLAFQQHIPASSLFFIADYNNANALQRLDLYLIKLPLSRLIRFFYFIDLNECFFKAYIIKTVIQLFNIRE